VPVRVRAACVLVFADPVPQSLAIVIRTPEGRYVHRRMRFSGSDLKSGLDTYSRLPNGSRVQTRCASFDRLLPDPVEVPAFGDAL
jgi:hypothetical protein